MGVQKARMLAGELYFADDPELAEDSLRATALIEQFNASSTADGERRSNLLRELLGSIGEGSDIRPPALLRLRRVHHHRVRNVH